MPKKPLKPLKKIEPLEPWVVGYLVTGIKPKNPSSKLMAWKLMSDNFGLATDLWKKNKWILRDFIKKHPGKRPFMWWEHDAPRWKKSFGGAFFEGNLPEPRKRIGGVGTPDYEHLSIVPRFEFGVPVGWLNQFLVDYYNGRAKDVHGKLIKCDYREGDFSGIALDPEDPPTYESQASYLKRHGFLSKSEESRLSDKDFEPETCLKYIKIYK